MKKKIDILKNISNYADESNYKGYSLYDSHNGPIKFEKLHKTLSFFINQIVKRFPFNLRKILMIKKGHNPKGLGLWMKINLFLFKFDTINSNIYKDRIYRIFKLLLDCKSNSNGSSWGYNYYWPKRVDKDVPPFTPNVVVTAFICKSLYEAYLILGDNEFKIEILKCEEFLKKDIHCFNEDNVSCFSYTIKQKDKVLNVNLLASEILYYADKVRGISKNKKKINECINFVINNQNDDGSWWYSFDYKTNIPKKQLDFHQGYVLESLIILKSVYNDKTSIEQSIKKGIDFYFNMQMNTEKGITFWRLPSKWPVDIHNQSQAIILSSILKKNIIANKLFNYTIKNFYSNNGYFYYQKWPFFTVKTHYLRWNTAWMGIAILNILKNETDSF